MATSTLETRLDRLLEVRKSRATYRSIKEYQTVQSASERKHAIKDELTDFSSNDYMSLTHSPYLRERYLERLQACSTPLFGSTGSRLLDGTTLAHTSLENRLSRYFAFAKPTRQETHPTSALLFNSGYDANVSFFSTVPQKGDYIVYDELVHASVWDGMRANARRGVPESHRFSFKHNSLPHLEQVLVKIAKQEQDQRSNGMIYVGIESLYSMDGDMVPLTGLVRLLNDLSRRYPDQLNQHTICVVLDEAHTTGIWGDKGRGLAWHAWASESPSSDYLSVEEWVKVRVMTFGKGVGSQGSVLIASPTVRQFLINYARPFIFSTAMSVNNVLAIESAFDILESAEGSRSRAALQDICQYFHTEIVKLLKTRKVPTSLLSLLAESAATPSAYGQLPTYIVPLITPQPHSLANHLRSKGFLTRPVVHPTVPRGKERVRICLHAKNQPSDVDGLIEGIAQWIEDAQERVVKAKL